MPDTFCAPGRRTLVKDLGQMSGAVVIGETCNFGSLSVTMVVEALVIGLVGLENYQAVSMFVTNR